MKRFIKFLLAMAAFFASLCAFVCVLVLVIYLLPQFVENKLNIDIPTALEVIIFVFVFAAEWMVVCEGKVLG